MVKRSSLEAAECPVARSVGAIGDGWSLLIIRDAFDGIRRFCDFQRNLGVARNVLATRLKSLVGHGVLVVVPASDGSAYQEYVLTEKGRGLFNLIIGLRQWGEAHFYGPQEPHSVMVDRERGMPLRPLELRAEDGRLVGPDDCRRIPAD
ncbi:winged helix-turn-helix transcriptional regulator [Pseudomonas vanderleydeniana]|uniref:Helix-turn-helix transcriptional regulator n=1 Tax=Pseudomonas vanderleydeniana TaxID=2745495 RepID=A0A9E6PPU2_9PSED|nr:helix-turn-helix domain-containing protein [Pseudomonas vanderleydeniana]QXI30378.1 helix-turn-helix transcriptional regulator [Pseudomonas vanderleydeniana]